MNSARALFVTALTATVMVVQSHARRPVITPRTNGKELGNSPQTTVCGDDLCLCSGDFADCSDRPGGLHYIPRLPSSIRHLNFSLNHLEVIHDDVFFCNVSNLNSLSLNGNDIIYISPGAFRTFSQLRHLTMDLNKVNYSSLSAILKISTLTHLSLKYCDLGKMPEGFFDKATLPRLRALHLSDNHIGDTRLSTFRRLPELRELDLANNAINRLEVDLVISRLDTLNLDMNGLFEFPITCYNGNSSKFPRLTRLRLTSNKIAYVGQACLPKLKVLIIAENSFSTFPTGTFDGAMFPSLLILYLYSMDGHIDTAMAAAFSNPSLRRISLVYNSISFNYESIDDTCFANCPMLERLELSHNFLDISEERFIRLFGHLARMKYLTMQDCGISVLTRRMLAGFPLLEVLLLDRNKLSRIPDGTFDGLRKLARLDLDTNQIRVVPSTLFGADTTRQRLTSLDLSLNPFTCSCDVLWFRSWFLSRPSLFARSWGNYTCFNVPGVDIGRFYLGSQACLLSRGVAVMIIISVSLVLLVLAVVFTVFRYRWHFRLLLHEASRGNGETRRRRLETGRFRYDLFVSYDADNLPWVLRHLVPQLEGRRGLRLCLHQRDFTPGRHIVDNIADCVESSKKVLMLFSTSFVQSPWCQFELALCLSHVMDYDDTLVIVCLDDVPSRDLTTTMMAVLKTTTYIQWVDGDDDATRSFWGRLDAALQEVYHCRSVQ